MEFLRVHVSWRVAQMAFRLVGAFRFVGLAWRPQQISFNASPAAVMAVPAVALTVVYNVARQITERRESDRQRSQRLAEQRWADAQRRNPNVHFQDIFGIRYNDG